MQPTLIRIKALVPEFSQTSTRVGWEAQMKRHAIVADLNETHMRLAVADIDALTIDHYVQFQNDAFGSFKEALEAYLRSLPIGPRSLTVAQTSAHPGKFDRALRALSLGDAERMGFTEAFCVTDASDVLAIALPSLTKHDLLSLGGQPAQERANKTAISLSSGLRVSTLVATETGSIFGGGAGSISFAAQTREDFEILERLRPDAHHVAVERLLSGPGIVLLYEVLLETGSKPATTMTPDEIIAAAHNGSDETAKEAVERFVTWLARFVGDVALMYDARGGIYLWGAIARQLRPWVALPSFRTTVNAKGRLARLVEAIPISLIESDDVLLKGAAIALSRHTTRGPLRNPPGDV
jgi:glucokinase